MLLAGVPFEHAALQPLQLVAGARQRMEGRGVAAALGAGGGALWAELLAAGVDDAVDVEVADAVPQVEVLGIEAGEYDVQRLLYHFFAKCYWNNDVSYEENVLVNYDWYHPQVATRHTLQEVEAWFEEAGLKIEHRCVDYYGITVRGRNV
jgi:hypothetical protein